jgi:hypothetical protein
MKQTTLLTGVAGRMEDVLIAENVSLEAGPLKANRYFPTMKFSNR